MDYFFVRLSVPLLCLAYLASGCTSADLTGGATAKKGGSKSESSGSASEPLGNSSATDSGKAPDNNAGSNDTGSNDAGDFAAPQDVAGAYLTCRLTTADAGNAEFGCTVFNHGQPDGRKIVAITQGTLLGAQANGVSTLAASVNSNDPTQIIVSLAATGERPVTKPVDFGMSLDLTFEDGKTAELTVPYKLYIPPTVYGPLPAPQGQICHSTPLADGRVFMVCNAESGGGGAIQVQWTRFPNTANADYTKYITEEGTDGICDMSRKLASTFVEGCVQCEKEPDWIKGIIALSAGMPPSTVNNVCFVVDTKTQIFGVEKKISGATQY